MHAGKHDLQGIDEGIYLTGKADGRVECFGSIPRHWGIRRAHAGSLFFTSFGGVTVNGARLRVQSRALSFSVLSLSLSFFYTTLVGHTRTVWTLCGQCVRSVAWAIQPEQEIRGGGNSLYCSINTILANSGRLLSSWGYFFINPAVPSATALPSSFPDDSVPSPLR